MSINNTDYRHIFLDQHGNRHQLKRLDRGSYESLSGALLSKEYVDAYLTLVRIIPNRIREKLHKWIVTPNGFRIRVRKDDPKYLSINN